MSLDGYYDFCSVWFDCELAVLRCHGIVRVRLGVDCGGNSVIADVLAGLACQRDVLQLILDAVDGHQAFH